MDGAKEKPNVKESSEKSDKVVSQEDKFAQNYRLDRDIYQKFLTQHKDGDVTYVQIDQQVKDKHRSSNVILMGADYENFEEKNIYKALNLVKPDAILLQVRPDLVLHKFKTFHQHTNTDPTENEHAYLK